MGNTIKIGKRSTEEVACWRVKTDTLTPNTEIIIGDDGVTALVTIDGVTRVCTKGKTTVYSMFNPGKQKKLIGGNKNYAEYDVLAIDQSSEFMAEWGLAGSNLISGKDFELDIPCEFVAVGQYRYKIENFVGFARAFALEGGVLTRDDIRESLRTETTAIIKNYLSAKLLAFKFEDCLANLEKYSAAILEEINARLANKGLTVYGFTISRIDYTEQHKIKRQQLHNVKASNAVNKAINEGRRDDISVEEMEAKRVVIPLIHAKNGSYPEKKQEAEDHKTEERIITCPRCGERNVNNNYCHKCGEKLI